MKTLPLVTVIVPIRNEAKFIAPCLEALLKQDYPPSQIEILVVDGLSNDGTRLIVQRMTEQTATITLLDNPQQIVSTALNIGLQQAQGEIIIRVDGHCEIAPNYISTCVRLLQARQVACVGGAIKTVGLGLVGQAIAVAQSSPFGVGGAHFRKGNQQQEQRVDTLAFGAYRATVFQEIGVFDEELVRNQDDEFNFRLTQAGGEILLSPEIEAIYYSRATWPKLWRQYYQYGYWKVRVMQKRAGVAAWRQLVPGFFVSGIIFSIVLSLITKRYLWLMLILGPYLIANLVASVWAASQKGWQYLPFLPISFAILHFSYGFGFLNGIYHFVCKPPIIQGTIHDK